MERLMIKECLTTDEQIILSFLMIIIAVLGIISGWIMRGLKKEKAKK